MSAPSVVVSGAFDNAGSAGLRFLQEAAKLGDVTVLLWPDEAVRLLAGRTPGFPFSERAYFLRAVRYVHDVKAASGVMEGEGLALAAGFRAQVWADQEGPANNARWTWCERHGIQYHIIPAKQLEGFPEATPKPALPGRKKVMVTGCYDWLHSGHVRFFEEVSQYGDLYVVVGHDANIRVLKGPGHPLLSQDERRYLVGSIRYVRQALISSGNGWLDAEPEIERIQPDIYAVNDDGDRGGKREYCAQRSIEYLVLKRTPAPGLPNRTSTELRGF
ncbi:MAG TPA: adenylyltransferase/cytidyltransferase family protein [Verrucomicrobiae bacterium]|nr:adenylyltransferase/cytidyltransferase family protein [Verrucomicrobiae bacterium]